MKKKTTITTEEHKVWVIREGCTEIDRDLESLPDVVSPPAKARETESHADAESDKCEDRR